MPSTSDESETLLAQGVQQLFKEGRAWLNRSRQPEHQRIASLLTHLLRFAGPQGRTATDDMLFRALARTRDSLPAACHAFFPDLAGDRPSILQQLPVTVALIVDHFLRRDPLFGPRYLRHAYILADKAMSYNGTSDTVRIRPVADWMVEVMSSHAGKPFDVVDIGCAVQAGCPGTRTAAHILREHALCRHMHAVDIVPPSRELQKTLLHHSRICVYQGNPVRRRLPRLYDAVLLANVHRHLARREQEALLHNLFESLHNQGYLFINWRFSDSDSPGICLQRQHDTVRLVSAKNCI
jgi:hypothetical protein